MTKQEEEIAEAIGDAYKRGYAEAVRAQFDWNDGNQRWYELGIERGLREGKIVGAAIVAMGQAIKDRYEACWACGAINTVHKTERDVCARCGGVLAYR